MTSSEAWPPPVRERQEVLFNCPWCGQGSHGMTQVAGKVMKPPERGCPMICPICGGVMVFVDLRTVRKPTEAEWGRLNSTPEVKAQRLEAIRASKALKRDLNVIDFVQLGGDD